MIDRNRDEHWDLNEFMNPTIMEGKGPGSRGENMGPGGESPFNMDMMQEDPNMIFDRYSISDDSGNQFMDYEFFLAGA